MTTRFNSKNNAGFVNLTFALVIGNLAVLGYLAISTIVQNQMNLRGANARRASNDMLAKSAMAVMEGALRRRLWSPPPDTDCLAKNHTSVSGSTGEASWVVDADYDFDSKMYTLTASVTRSGAVSKLLKKVKISDVTDAMVVRSSLPYSVSHRIGDDTYGQSPRDFLISGNLDLKNPTALIAEGRTIFVSGKTLLNPVSFHSPQYFSDSNMYVPNNDFSSPSPAAADPLKEYNIVIQGSKIYLIGGVAYYGTYGLDDPWVDQYSTSTNITVLNKYNSLNLNAPLPWAPTPLPPVGSSPPAYYRDLNYAVKNAFSGITTFFGGSLLGATSSGHSGRGVFFSDANEAKDFVNYLKGNTVVINTNNLYKHVYPSVMRSVANSSAPYKLSSLSDSGRYLPEPTDAYYFRYSKVIPLYTEISPNVFVLSNLNSTNAIANLQCVFQNNTNAFSSKYTNSYYNLCSDSEYSPNGFARWRSEAGLDNVIVTDSVTADDFVKIPTIGPNEMAALKEDAAACGFVLTPSTAVDSYEDCPIWDNIFMSDIWDKIAAGTPTAFTCHNIYKPFRVIDSSGNKIADLSKNILNNFDVAAYHDAANSKRILRRVVYSSEIMEIGQSSPRGIMSDLLDNDVRQKMPIWIVGEEYINLRSYQPVDRGAGQAKLVSFNKDICTSCPNAVSPLSLVVLTPAKPHLISYNYPNLTKSDFIASLDTNSSHTNFLVNPLNSGRWENDAFVTGPADYEVNNLAVIQVMDDSFEKTPFFLKGFWAIPGNESSNLWYSDYIMRTCAVNRATAAPYGAFPAQVGGYFLYDDYFATARNQDTSTLPPRDSNYFWHDLTSGIDVPKISPEMVPYSFWVDNLLRTRHKSTVIFSGFDYGVNFDVSMHPRTSHLTSADQYTATKIYRGIADILFTPGTQYSPVGDCASYYPNGSHHGSVYTNAGAHDMVYNSPDASVVQFGNLTGTILPTTGMVDGQ